jgi:hypothetical protein
VNTATTLFVPLYLINEHYLSTATNGSNVKRMWLYFMKLLKSNKKACLKNNLKSYNDMGEPG